MKTDKNGCLTCQKGQEQYEEYRSAVTGQKLIQYDFRSQTGKLFSCVAVSIEIARERRDAWLANNQEAR